MLLTSISRLRLPACHALRRLALGRSARSPHAPQFFGAS
jgi:hypothetical protein